MKRKMLLFKSNRLITYDKISSYKAKDQPKITKNEAVDLATQALKEELKLIENPKVIDTRYEVVSDKQYDSLKIVVWNMLKYIR